MLYCHKAGLVNLLLFEMLDCFIITLALCCRENNMTGVIDTTFSVEHNSFGVLRVHELKPGGRDILVTEENKKEYVK